MIPNIMKNDMFWEGFIKLADWDKYFKTDLNIILNIGGDCIIDEITDTHEKGYQYIRDQQANILKIAINEIYNHYAIWQEEYDYEGEEKRLLMPDIMDKEGLKRLLEPRRIYILDTANDNLPYYGIEFQCSWDEEHGVGIMFHRNRVIKIGGADTAFSTWIAVEDKGE